MDEPLLVQPRRLSAPLLRGGVERWRRVHAPRPPLYSAGSNTILFIAPGTCSRIEEMRGDPTGRARRPGWPPTVPG